MVGTRCSRKHVNVTGEMGIEVAAARGIYFIDVAEMFPVPPKAQTQGRTEVLPRHLAQKAEARQVDRRHENYGARPRVRLVRGGPGPIGCKNHSGGTGRQPQTTDYIDHNYQIHWPDRYLPLSATRFMTRSNNEQRRRGTLQDAVLAEIDTIHQRYPNPAI